MKKILALILCLGFGLVFAQTQETKIQPVEDHPTEQQYSPEDTKHGGYPGGMAALQKDIADRIQIDKITPIKGRFFSKVKFTVNAKGKIENILVTGDLPDLNREIEEIIKSLETKWKPAESNEVMVRNYYTFPVTLEFE
ncbi:hypothetical protein [Chryseobacterium sp.]|uniref:energy transducer TonB n=1 Tax=Chryseobacterium sp. TaxID=1871047 RepID=UPI00284F98C8|nr:hypothetical protein [Chryseobacterium sp.]MDR3024183.1 hypothetical protein [Chryseobacterium sp.]